MNSKYQLGYIYIYSTVKDINMITIITIMTIRTIVTRKIRIENVYIYMSRTVVQCSPRIPTSFPGIVGLIPSPLTLTLPGEGGFILAGQDYAYHNHNYSYIDGY